MTIARMTSPQEVNSPVEQMAEPDLDHAFAHAFAHAGLAMAVVSLGGRILRANEALAQMTGLSVSALSTTRVADLLHGADLGADLASTASAQPAPEVDHRELRLRHKSGRFTWVLRTRHLVPAAAGRPACFVDQLLDLTERKRAEKEIVLLNNLLEKRIQRRTAELEESNEDLRDFAYSIAHDLRAPLASIDGFSAQLAAQLEGRLDERGARYLQRVRAGVRHMAELTDGLLALTDLSRADLQHEPVDMTGLVRAIMDRLALQDPDRRLVLDLAPTPWAKGDRRLLADLLENLLGNAWKFTRKRDVARIAFRATTTEAGHPVYIVEDNGAGFDPAYATRLFTPFLRLHTAAEFEGTGIGLAVVRKIVARHGGRVWAEAAPEAGARFLFTLGEGQPERASRPPPPVH